jgi:iron complex outermembrane receptor protein
VYAKAEWRVAEGLTFTPQFNWVMDRKREFGDTRPPVPDYKSLDLTLRSTKIRNFDISVSVRNLFDADIREPALSAIPNDLPQAGRAVYLQLIYKL